MTLTNVRIRQIIQLLAGLAAIALCILVLVARPDPNEDAWLAWAGISAGIGLAAGFIA